MRIVYMVIYDICSPEHLRTVYKTMRSFRDKIQYSIFRGELNKTDLVKLAALLPLLEPREDQVIIVPLGLPGGRYDARIYSLGRFYNAVERKLCYGIA
jgi:CRISPR-associated endonuclease Cas2